MPKNHNIVEIAGEVFHETDAAYQFSDGTRKHGNLLPEKTWVPKSQCEWDGETMQMPEWLAIEKGFL